MPDEGAGQEQTPGLQDAIREAVESDPAAVAVVTGQKPDGEAPAGETQQPVPPGESAPSTVDTQTPEASVESAEGQPKPPEKYWGTDLTGLSDEQKREVVSHFEQQDGYIRSLQEQLAKAPERQAPVVEEPTVVTDEDLLRAAGYNPEDIEVQQSAAFIVPLLRNQLQLEERVEMQEQWVQATEAKTQWNSAIDELEAEFGALPGDRVNVLQEALDKGYASPYETYFRLATPARQDVAAFVAELRQKQQREAGQRDASGGLRPSSSGSTETTIKEGMTLREAVKIAAKEAEKETKLSWVDAVKSRVTRGAQGPAQPGA